ncbi:hypothetical protein, unlikely [Trypanosoma brucei gambiense DAL972]|uniref:Uncharacterized protein n=1 Tax=Trypanosoma brucei gambiense (strain MHOM/CI/86/DAL972) TaxID=679716 RepID=D0A3Q6_TRYB9|nr:hypothetical protein, unlikely [Trypanosoma brucei gambiense DAL972]CBH15900.1 hypothetical protein, unlikely [Trypanosoma brucei gambiense DAL972]|eukprot:XP_011778164.1 hypothetical protein, unlikely [Trypanosoma brucei gambiense DAL972]
MVLSLLQQSNSRHRIHRGPVTTLATHGDNNNNRKTIRLPRVVARQRTRQVQSRPDAPATIHDLTQGEATMKQLCIHCFRVTPVKQQGCLPFNILIVYGEILHHRKRGKKKAEAEAGGEEGSGAASLRKYYHLQ